MPNLTCKEAVEIIVENIEERINQIQIYLSESEFLAGKIQAYEEVLDDIRHLLIDEFNLII